MAKEFTKGGSTQVSRIIRAPREGGKPRELRKDSRTDSES
jgi:hypothetical protein